MHEGRAPVSAPCEGTTASLFDGLHLYRVSAPSQFRKTRTFGPALVVVAQGRKVATIGGAELAYDENHYFVVMCDTYIEGVVLEASARRPYLALCLTIPPEIVCSRRRTWATGGSPRSHRNSVAYRARVPERWA
jgi:hypothetical protein